MLRAGPFSDEDVQALAKLRFVPFYFDLSNAGAAADKDARAVVVKARKNLRGMAVDTPPILFMSAEGEVLGDVANYADTKAVLAAMQKVLQQHPQYDQPSPSESEGTPLQRALVLAGLQQFDDALALATTVDEPAARLLCARLLRKQGKAAAAREHLDKITGAELVHDVAIERSLLAWHAGEFAAMADLLRDVPSEHARYSEARYHFGLSWFHRDDTEQARAVWKELVTGRPQDRWVYRADWAFVESGSKPGNVRTFRSTDKAGLLGRIGYMGRNNPDLKRR